MFINNSQAKTMKKQATSSIKSRQDSLRLKKAWALVRGGAPPTNSRNAATGIRTESPARTGFQNRVGSKPKF